MVKTALQGPKRVNRFRQSEAMLAVDMDGETVMMSLAQGAYFGLNGAAGVLWEALAEPQDAESLSRCLVATYGIDPDTARRDVAAFIAQMQENALITPCD